MKDLHPLIRKSSGFFILIILLTACKKYDGEIIETSGLKAPVEVIRDHWGVNHIYAENQHDLFFAQGYFAARDRLFQFEIWRRQATGTVAEILGPRELKRDIGTRLFQFRGDMKQEMDHYHPDGEEIITAYVDGVNAFIEEVMEDTAPLPVEFKMLGIVPEKWTPEVVISRHQGLLGNINRELAIGRAVNKIGSEKVKELIWFHPKEPRIDLDTAINGELLSTEILEIYNAFRRSVQFQPEDILPAYRRNEEAHSRLNSQVDLFQGDPVDVGSNNWVVKGDLNASGNTIMANDPHRRIAVPSLRYMVHLVAPGWNVIGGGEPEIPGVSIGHNEYGAWGLTVFRTDGEDLYVYDINPENLAQYDYNQNWEDMEVISDTIVVKGSEDVITNHYYTRHGPVTYIDSINLKAYAIRCAWLEPGGSPYLASLRMDQAKNWEEFREACNYSHIPGENMVWADNEGNIGWQAVGIAPLRHNFSGLVPVPGDGRYEWDGYLPIKDKPHIYNPEEKFFATANQNVTPASYEYWDAIGFLWSDPYRGDRINSVLSSNQNFTMDDMKKLQTDYYSIPASIFAPLLEEITFEDELTNAAREMLLEWDFTLQSSSIEAGIYVAWERKMKESAHQHFVPEEVNNILYLQLKTLEDWIVNEEDRPFGNEIISQEEFLKKTFFEAVQELENKFGSDPGEWVYGQEAYKHIRIFHPLGRAVNDYWQNKLNVGIAPRGGNSYTPNSTGGNNNQTHGASFRIITDTGNWDRSVGMNTPGQSGSTESPYYSNLFQFWADDKYFPLYYSKEKIDSVSAEKIQLKPMNGSR